MAHSLLKLSRNPAHEYLAEHYPQAFSLKKGTTAKIFVGDEPGYRIEVSDKKVEITGGSQADLIAALGQWLTAPGKNAHATPPFDFRAVMIDSSRNGVMHLAQLKRILPQLALLGLNAACLYTEDTYEVKGHPLIGYQRGKYTQAELKELDTFARHFGIELFPCIQTLGHLAHLLKYWQYQHLRDDPQVLNIQLKETYRLLETMIKSAVAPYQSKRIHLGMDETHGLGLGKTFNPQKPLDPRSMYVDHVQKVGALCKRLKLEPIMWGDIVIGMTGTQAMDKKQFSKLPRNVEMNYWDYYREDPKIYDQRIQQYRKMKFEPLISPGVWNWNRFWPSFDKMDMSCVPFMNIAKRRGVRRAMITMWGDDGQECPFDANFPALALYLEHCMTKTVNLNTVKARMRAVTGNDFDAFILPQKMDQYPGVKKSAVIPMNLGKALIWDDPLLARVAAQAGGRRLGGYYAALAKQVGNSVADHSGIARDNLHFAHLALEFLALKADLHPRARQAYAKDHHSELRRVAKDLGTALRSLTALRDQHRKLWMVERKPFGWERLDLRYGGQLARLESLRLTLNAYLAGKQKSIPEFDEKVEPLFVHYPLIHRVLGYDFVATPSTAYV